MNKKQAFEKMWIDFETRLPPNTEEEILIYIDMIGCVELTTAMLARIQHTQMKSKIFQKRQRGNEKEFKKQWGRTGYFADKWMKIFKP